MEELIGATADAHPVPRPRCKNVCPAGKMGGKLQKCLGEFKEKAGI